MEEEKIIEEFIEEKPKRQKKGRGKKVISVLLIILLAGGTGFAGGMLALHSGFNPWASSQTPNPITINTEDHVNTAEAVAAKVIPSVVGISTTTEIVRQNIFGMLSGEIAEGVGTGIIVNEDGFILTNSHVVSDGRAKTITVQLPDGRELKGTVLWNDTVMDLAVIKVDATDLTPVELGDSDEVNIGAYAVAIGNPLGLAFDRSVTQGVISGLNRTVTVSGPSGQTTMEGLMQTDASINAGNSGGPLLNSKGQLIGINTAKAASGEGLGFAIPINTAKPIVEEVMETGTFSKAFIGISGENVELYLQYYPQDNLGTKTGVYITKINEGSPAALAELEKGDVITALEDQEIKTKEQLTRELFAYKPGDTVTLTIYRDGKKMTVDVVLGTMG
ncbi:MAG: trypsin-like peptidase domain-containing protein [Eubacteriales bacterium]|nr:trypsin-like peptidase domain-containing protein [Eubacteriales bacterium]MDD3874835.1 trypsin-like peptidase domain-containing protein [Methanosarcina sp.]MDD4583438.1 trypsin-like peptidase domain-containing protein [Eubacteriales bacterium]